MCEVWKKCNLKKMVWNTMDSIHTMDKDLPKPLNSYKICVSKNLIQLEKYVMKVQKGFVLLNV